MSFVEIVEEGHIQTSIRLPKDLLKRAKKYAIDNDTSLAAILIESLETYLDKKES
jgi:predicted DNA-binding protein